MSWKLWACTTMTELSPAAQVVLSSANGACCYGPDDVLNDSQWIAAAALRAAADQVVIKLAGLGQESAWYLEEIAAELEAQ
jgi:hypothetical protein